MIYQLFTELKTLTSAEQVIIKNLIAQFFQKVLQKNIENNKFIK